VEAADGNLDHHQAGVHHKITDGNRHHRIHQAGKPHQATPGHLPHLLKDGNSLHLQDGNPAAGNQVHLQQVGILEAHPVGDGNLVKAAMTGGNLVKAAMTGGNQVPLLLTGPRAAHQDGNPALHRALHRDGKRVHLLTALLPAVPHQDGKRPELLMALLLPVLHTVLLPVALPLVGKAHLPRAVGRTAPLHQVGKTVVLPHQVGRLLLHHHQDGKLELHPETDGSPKTVGRFFNLIKTS